LRIGAEVYELLIPFARGDVMASIHREGEVLAEVPESASMRYTARLDAASAARLGQWIVHA
jgi:GTP-binding protein HflX